MKRKMKALLAVMFTAILALNLVSHEAEAAPDNTAYLAYADESWTYQYWGDEVDTGVVATTAEITGAGQYTIGLDFTATADGKAGGIAFAAPIIAGGSVNFPGYFIQLDSIVINGAEVEFTKNYTSSDDDVELRSNIYNTWVAELPDDARTPDGDLDGASAVIVDSSVFEAVETINVTFTLIEGSGEVTEPVETEEPEYVAPSEFTAFLMYSAVDNGWSDVYSAIDGVNTVTVLGDGTYTVTLKGSDIGATGQPTALNVFCIDIPELAAAMQNLGKNINNYNEDKEHGLATDLEVSAEVYVDGKKVRCKSELINYGDIEEKGTFRMEFYNTWGLHGGFITENPPVLVEALLPESEISVTFRLKGTGFNTEAAAAEEEAQKQEEEKQEEKQEDKTEDADSKETSTPDTSVTTDKTEGGLSTPVIIAIVLGAIVIIGGIVFVVLKKKKN